MLYVEFLKWVGKQGLKSKVLQKYLNTAWQEAIKGGKVVLKTHFPKILGKAKDYHEGFKRAGLEVVKPIKVPEQTKNILNIKSTLKGRPVKVVPESKVGDAMKVLEEVVVGPAKIIKFPKTFKKPPRKPKADGGSIDKTLPGRSRDI
jgi:hypothetical protein